MLERDYLVLQYFSKDIIDRRIEILKSGMMHDAAASKEKSFLAGTLNLFGFLMLGLFLLLIPG